MTIGDLADQTTHPSTGSWLPRAWRTSRVAIGTSIAEAVVIWLGVQALSNASVGSISLGPVVVATLLVGVVPILPLGLSATQTRVVSLLTVLVAGLILIRGLSFPDAGWTDPAWLIDIGDSLILRGDSAVMPVWVPLLVTAGAWWWRRRRGGNATDDVRTSLRIGAVALIVVASIGAFSGMATQGQIATAGTVFFAAILLAMSWARQAAVHPGELSGGTSVAALTSIGGVAVIIVVATALVAIANPAAFDTLIWLLSPVFWVIRFAILGLSWVLLIASYPVFWLVGWVVSHGSNPPPRPMQEAAASPPADALQSTASTASLPDEYRLVLASVILVALVLLVTRQALRRAVAVPAPSDVEQHVEMDLRSLFRRRRSVPVSEADPLDGLRADPRYRDTVAIREIYARFLAATAEAGLGRHRSETARHHAQRVATALGTPLEDIRLLTGIYGDVRYEDDPATDGQRRAVTATWERVAPRLDDLAAARSDRRPSRARSRRRG